MSIPRLDEKDFTSLRCSASVRKRLRLVTPEHVGALGCYLALLPVWLLFAVYGGYALDRAGLYPGRWFFVLLLGLALIVPLLPLLRVRRHFRRPVLDELAEQLRLDYASHDFELEAFEDAKPMLFGEGATATLTDLLAGKGGGDEWAICHAEIEAAGEAAYSGLLYWLRRKGSNATIVLVPAESAGRVKVPKKVRRVTLAHDPAFESAFAIFANDADYAERLFDDEFRRRLLDHAGHGPVYFYFARNDTFLAAGPPASFESAEEAALRPEPRLRAIFDNVSAALEVARAVRPATERA